MQSQGSQERYMELAEKWLNGTITGAEEKEFADWYNSGQDETTIHQSFAANREQLRKKILTKINESREQQPATVIPIGRRSYIKRIAVAASILLVIGLGAYIVTLSLSKGDKEDVIANNAKQPDISAPDKTKATIQLANGQTIYLDSAANGTLALQQNVQLIKTADGKISYIPPESIAPGFNPGTVEYNTLSNPRGSKVIDITLSDGSKVWLNAGSSLRYPASFASSRLNRTVEITGEAYFEIAHDKTKPFIVSANDKADVTILGTHFNVNAYDDEQEIKVTLLEGSVRVAVSPFSTRGEGQGMRLKPGQQAVMASAAKQTILVQTADLEQTMAWKNELFSLKSADIKTVMRQIARWYNVDIEYKGEITEKFIVKMNRNTNVSNVFKILEATGAVHFNIEGRKITVMK